MICAQKVLTMHSFVEPCLHQYHEQDRNCLAAREHSSYIPLQMNRHFNHVLKLNLWQVKFSWSKGVSSSQLFVEVMNKSVIIFGGAQAHDTCIDGA